MDQDELKVSLSPAIPAYLIGEDKRISAKFLGNVTVTYNLGAVRDYIPGNYTVKEMNAMYENGKKIFVTSGVFGGSVAKDIREGKVKEIVVTLE